MTDPRPRDDDDSVVIGFPVRCHYRGGNRTLGSHGVHLRIKDGRIGHGEFSLTHGIALAEVTSVDVKERQEGGSGERLVMAQGLPLGGLVVHPSSPQVVTDVTVRTEDGQDALWVVTGRGGAWVRGRLTPVLAEHGIPYYDDLPPDQRRSYP